MTDSTEMESTSPGGHSASHAESEQSRQRGKRSGSRRSGRPQDNADQQRQPRPRIDRAMIGFGDGIERATCQSVVHVPPRSFPVQHRTGLAAVELVVVDRNSAAVLLCDRQHEGPHIWPNGDVVGGSRFNMPEIILEPGVESE